MENSEKREMTLEELQKQCKEAKKNFEVLNEQLKKVQQEEEKRKKEQLANEKDVRYEEIELASKHLNDLIQKYIDDYGSFSFSRSYSDDKNNYFPYCYHWLF